MKAIILTSNTPTGLENQVNRFLARREKLTITVEKMSFSTSKFFGATSYYVIILYSENFLP